MLSDSLDQLRAAIRDVPDFPKPGILFKDITPVLADGRLLSLAIDGMVEPFAGQPVDKVVGIDARGFIFGAMMAQRLGCGFVPVRKKGKLPWKTRGVDAALQLIAEAGGVLLGSAFFVELSFLEGREKLAHTGSVHSLLTF